MPELYSQHRRLQGIEATVGPDLIMYVAFTHAEISQATDSRRHSRIFSDNAAAVTKGAEVLGGIEAERGGGSYRARTSPPPGRAKGLGCVFDHCQVVLGGD